MAHLKVLLSIRLRIIGDLEHNIREIEKFTSETNTSFIIFREIALEKAFQEFIDIMNKLGNMSIYGNDSEIQTSNRAIKNKYMAIKLKINDCTNGKELRANVSSLSAATLCSSNKKLPTNTVNVSKSPSTPIDSNFSHIQVPKFEHQQQQTFNSYGISKPPINNLLDADFNHSMAQLTRLPQLRPNCAPATYRTNGKTVSTTITLSLNGHNDQNGNHPPFMISLSSQGASIQPKVSKLSTEDRYEQITEFKCSNEGKELELVPKKPLSLTSLVNNKKNDDTLMHTMFQSKSPNKMIHDLLAVNHNSFSVKFDMTHNHVVLFLLHIYGIRKFHNRTLLQKYKSFEKNMNECTKRYILNMIASLHTPLFHMQPFKLLNVFKRTKNRIHFPLFLLLFEQIHRPWGEEVSRDEYNLRLISSISKPNFNHVIESFENWNFNPLCLLHEWHNSLQMQIRKDSIPKLVCECISDNIEAIFMKDTLDQSFANEHRLDRKFPLKYKYSMVKNEYAKISNHNHFMPYRTILMETSLTTKLRIMYESIAQITNVFFLNKNMHMHIVHTILEKLWTVFIRRRLGMIKRRPKLKNSFLSIRASINLMIEKDTPLSRWILQNFAKTFLSQHGMFNKPNKNEHELKEKRAIEGFTFDNQRKHNINATIIQEKHKIVTAQKTFKSCTIYTHTIPNYRPKNIHNT